MAPCTFAVRSFVVKHVRVMFELPLYMYSNTQVKQRNVTPKIKCLFEDEVASLVY